MKLLAFTPFSDGIPEGNIYINPDQVVSVLERELRPSGGFYQQVAVIELTTGHKYTVLDSDRTVAQQLTEEGDEEPERRAIQ